jgi:hypothetical protein
MRRTVVMAACLLATFWALPGSAWAVVAQWTLQGVVFDDGGTASGSFSFDTVTNTFSDINVTTTAGSARPGATYHFAHADFSFPFLSVFLTVDGASDQTGLPLLELVFDPGLDHFAVQQLVSPGSGEGTCANAPCTIADLTAPVRFLVAGTAVTTTALPTLSTWGTLLFVLSMLAVGTWQLAGRPTPGALTARRGRDQT